jgi:hypothetical protein
MSKKMKTRSPLRLGRFAWILKSVWTGSCAPYVGSYQGDQMSLQKNRPKSNPIHFCQTSHWAIIRPIWSPWQLQMALLSIRVNKLECLLPLTMQELSQMHSPSCTLISIARSLLEEKTLA